MHIIKTEKIGKTKILLGIGLDDMYIVKADAKALNEHYEKKFYVKTDAEWDYNIVRQYFIGKESESH